MLHCVNLTFIILGDNINILRIINMLSGVEIVKIKESGENYLETILLLEKRNGSVRSVDIANEMEFSKPSISRAMSILKANGMIDVAHGGQIMLTEKGRSRAESIFERHSIIKSFLMDVLKVSSECAEHDACKIEHIISDETITAIKKCLTDKIIDK